jgi:hypothetical protein
MRLWPFLEVKEHEEYERISINLSAGETLDP